MLVDSHLVCCYDEIRRTYFEVREADMKLPLQITSRDFTLTEPMKADITERTDKLEKFFGDITRCRVVLETPHRHRHDGILFNVRLEITIPGRELVIKREPHEDLYVAIRQAFDAAGRQLEEFARMQRGEVKNRAAMPVGRVKVIFQE